MKYKTNYEQQQIKLTVTKAEREEIKLAAREMSKSVSEYLRYRLRLPALARGRRLKVKD